MSSSSSVQFSDNGVNADILLEKGKTYSYRLLFFLKNEKNSQEKKKQITHRLQQSVFASLELSPKMTKIMHNARHTNTYLSP